MDSRGEDLDRADVRRVLAGEVEAFEGIVRRWQGPLVNLAYRFCRDPGRAEEMAQDAFLRAFRFLGRWREDAAFSTWLFAVATNVYRSHLRRVRPVEVPLEPHRELPDSHNPVDEVESSWMSEKVRRTVSLLPAKYRDALILFYFEELDTAEVARCLGVREGTVKARLHRARAMLRQRLASVVHPQQSAEAT